MAKEIQGVVILVIEEYDQIEVEDATGKRYAAVGKFIKGLKFEDHFQGQKVKINVEALGKFERVTSIAPLSP